MSSVVPSDKAEDSNTLISIVIPVYNGMPHIMATIDSVRRQTYSRWELIICDDLSNDETVASVRRALEEKPDARIRLLTYKDRAGMTKNWNRSLECAGGNFIKILPADDILLPRCLEIQESILREYPDVGFVTGAKEIINSAGRKLFTRRPLKKGKYDWLSLGPHILRSVSNVVGEPGSVLFRRDILFRSGNYDEQYKYFVDIELCLRVLKLSHAFVCEEVLCQFRIHGASGSASSRRAALEEYRRLLDRYGAELGFSGRPWLRPYLELKSWAVVWLRSLVFHLCGRA